MSTLEVKELSHPAGEVIKIAAGKTLDLKTQGSVTMPTGSVLQVVTAKTNLGFVTTTSTSFVDSGMTASITPKFSTSKILVTFHVGMAIGYTNGALMTILARNGSVIGGGTTYANYSNVAGASTTEGLYHPYMLTTTDSPNTTSAVTYSVKFASSASGVTVHAAHAGTSVNISLMEIQG